MTMPSQSPILVSDGRYGLPYSKGLMAQSLMASGMPPSRAYALAKEIEDRLRAAGETRVGVERLRQLASDVLEELVGADISARYRKVHAISRMSKPLVVLVGGTTGVGKSTIATEVAHRLGITRISSTDSIREVMRGIFSKDLLPAIYESSFNAWRGLRVPVPHGANPVIVGFREQTAVVATGITSLVERAVTEGVSTVIEGVHIVPGYIEPSQFGDARVVQLVVAVDDEEAHRSHFYIREVQTDGSRAFERYRANFRNIRLLGEYIEDLAVEHGVPIVHSHQLDKTVAEALELVVNAAIGDEAGAA
jgi:2-phosphoglycerate kinase